MQLCHTVAPNSRWFWFESLARLSASPASWCLGSHDTKTCGFAWELKSTRTWLWSSSWTGYGSQLPDNGQHPQIYSFVTLTSILAKSRVSSTSAHPSEVRHKPCHVSILATEPGGTCVEACLSRLTRDSANWLHLLRESGCPQLGGHSMEYLCFNKAVIERTRLLTNFNRQAGSTIYF